jgi:hypothetical protein
VARLVSCLLCMGRGRVQGQATSGHPCQLSGPGRIPARGALLERTDLAAGTCPVAVVVRAEVPGPRQLSQRPGVAFPGDQVVMMSRPVTPCRSLTTDDSLMADSSSFSACCFSRVRSPVRSRRYRVCSRMIRNSGVATGTGQPFDGVATANLRNYHRIPYPRPARGRRAHPAAGRRADRRVGGHGALLDQVR